MNASIRAMRLGLFSLALLETIGATNSLAQSVTPDETVRSVQRTLERLPYYGVFDYIVFRVNGGTVYLAGYSFEGRLKSDAEMAAKRATGVVEVGNQIEVFPPLRTTTESAGPPTTASTPTISCPGTPLAVCTASSRNCETSGTSQGCSPSADIPSTSSSRTGERCCWVSSTTRATGSSQKCALAR
jgi:hypothetical protein